MLLPLLPAIAAIFLLELFMPTTRTELHSQATTALIAIAGPILTLLIAGGLVGTVLVAGYYRRRFGRVSPTWRTRMAGGILGGLGAFGFNYALDTGLVPYSLFKPGPVNVGLLIIAAGFTIYWLLTGRFLTHYLVLAAAGIVVGLAPLVGLHPAGRWWEVQEATVYLAVIAGFGGYLDHRTLVHGLGALSNTA